MKISIHLFMLLFALQVTAIAQWTTSGGSIYNSNTGNVGIGMTAPGFKLDVGAPARVKGAIYFNNSDEYPAESWMNFFPGLGDPYTLYFNGLHFDQNYGKINLNVSHHLELSYGSSCSFFSKIWNGTSYNPTKRLFIGSDGNVAIGSHTPNAKLDVAGIVQAWSNASAYVRTGTDNNNFPFISSYTNPLLIGGAGTYQMSVSATNVGIGTLTPNNNAKLDVNGNIYSNGKLLIGTTDLTQTANYSLAVNGNAIFNKVKVKLYGNWADYVFEPGYELISLDSVERFIKKYKHLPYLQSAAEIEKDGQDLGAIQSAMVRTIEELTLHNIELNKKVSAQETELQQLKNLVLELAEKMKYNYEDKK